MLTLQEKEFLDTAQTGNVQKLEAMLQSFSQLINSKTNDGRTAIHLAASGGQNNTIEFLSCKRLKVRCKN